MLSMNEKEVKTLMKKFMSLLLSMLFVCSMMVMMGCSPKEEATQAAPTAMEEATQPVDENAPISGEEMPAEGQAAPAE